VAWLPPDQRPWWLSVDQAPQQHHALGQDVVPVIDHVLEARLHQVRASLASREAGATAPQLVIRR
jgi:hypothetical protein